MGESREAVHAEPSEAEDAAAGAVRPDQVLRTHNGQLTRRAVANPAGNPVLVLLEGFQLVAEPRVTACVTDGVHQHGLEHRLRAVGHGTRARLLILACDPGAGSPGFRAEDLAARHTGDPQVVAHELLLRRHGVETVLDTQVAHDLDGSLVDDVRPRRVRGGRVSLDEQVLDAIARQGERGDQSRRPRTHDHDRDVPLLRRHAHHFFLYTSGC